jgi:Protein of unknown function (DUF2934)
MIETEKEPTREDIARRAYDLYVLRGSKPGNDIEDWIRAENELGAEALTGSARTTVNQIGRN